MSEAIHANAQAPPATKSTVTSGFIKVSVPGEFVERSSDNRDSLW
jgi:hypothetical protein